ncbi:hypothetical protein M409DRAFT_69107 [Zasmidium cellare ATCC 36951]|uniref:Uncharacterized protein n=1 Tax=Zasmidium cellare ATCC 36951 TaxID=1080233 RepID=A0A6A6C6R2_ZASCE|nr:uncharacterized protein M409DRAFT_69107 [Zasmidium cellare ATCC 36951]KAF2162533.1 hypothetical protein M409DRAFT_69107 [Zasmidium cellare ATCC 36951]
MADEALACFTCLLENVPGWIADLESILKSAAERQEEILFANRPEEDVVVPSVKKAKSKSSSLKSRRSVESQEKVQENGLLARPQMKHLTNSDALRLSQRKRKTASVCSGNESGPSKLRARAAAVVYYDGETQKQFEKLVRTVGSTRNSIRKGKMSAKVDCLSRSGSSGSEASGSSGDDMAKDDYRPPRGFGRDDGTEVFDRVDSRLEKGQNLCERAAHQVLRDGDCTLEVTNAKEHFSEALKMAEAEIPILQKKADKAAERRRRSEERRRAEEEEAEEKRRSQLSETIRNAVSNVTYPGEGKLEVDHLEVDDDDEDDEDAEFDIGHIHGKGMCVRAVDLCFYGV